jgi:hypothetical protein
VGIERLDDEANNMSPAVEAQVQPTTAEPEGGLRVCKHCHQTIKIVPGGTGSIWVHEDGYRPCKGAGVSKGAPTAEPRS